MRSKILHLLTGIFILVAFTQCKESISPAGPSPDPDSDLNVNLNETTLIIPGNNSEQSTSTSFKWEEVEGAESYQIQLSGDKNFSSIIVDSTSTSTEFEIQGLPYDSTIHWQVRPVTGQQQGPWSVAWQFITMQKPDNSEPISTDLKSPGDGASDRSTNVELNWTAVASASAYKMQIATDQNFSSMIVNKEVKGTSYQASDLDYEAIYYWRVEPIVAEEETEWSEVFDFVTQKESEETPSVTLVSPSDDASGLSTSPTLEWEELSGIDEYQVQLATSSSFTSPAIDENTSQQSLDLSGLDNDQSYYWRVQAKNDGDSQNWSSVRSFNTKPENNDDGDSNSDYDGPNSVEGDRQALMDLYQATSGSNWRNNSGWGNGNPSDSWHGVDVDGDGRVVRVDLSGNNLSGSLPESIGNLNKVRYFNVKQNEMSGSIPSSIGNMTSLTHLLLNGRIDDMTAKTSLHPGKPYGGYQSSERSNNFTGSLPSTIGNLSNLEWLEISGSDAPGETGLTGALPAELGKLINLKGLSLGFNSITSIPNLGNLTQLVHLVFEGSDNTSTLDGTGFPNWVSKLTNLKYLWMGRNQFGGELPDLSALTKMEIFIVTKNNLGGDFPDYVIDGTMPNMNMCSMGWNNFTGTLPEFGSGVSVTMFVVNQNSLHGEIPSSIATQTRMINLGLGWNDFSGDFPSDLSNMRQLRFIYANDNNFTGTVPLLDTDNSALNFLRFQNNRMSGTIPSSLSGIENLPRINDGDLDVRNNNFSQSDVQPLLDALSNDNILRY